MTRKTSKILGPAMALLLLVGSPRLLAQANTTTAQIEGSVRDDSGGGLPGVSVEATNVENGLKRSAVSDGTGRYLLSLLPPGKYSVSANLSGFASVNRTGLVLTLGSSSRVDLLMKLSSVSETLTVTGEAPVIESSRSAISATVDQNEIKNLPLQTRNFTDLVVLTPGATSDDSNRVHLGGQRGINNSFNVDGADSNSSFFGEQRGGTRPPFTFSQGSIQEFQVISSSYAAQYGNATGGIINAITKSGTNDFHAEVFGFYRSKALTETDAAGFLSKDFEQKQYGGFVGGPLVHDRLFFFGGYDAQRLTDPFDAAYDNRGTASDPLLVPANLAKLQSYGIDPDTEWGVINQTNDVDSPFVKLSWNASDSVTVTARDNYNKQTGANLTNSRNFANNGLSNNGLERNFFNSFVTNINWVASASVFNEFIGQTATEHRPRTANAEALPETVISQFGRFGKNNFLPNNLDETRFQLVDNVTFYLGSNTVKAGADYSRINFSDEFFRYRSGVYNFTSFSNFVAGKPSAYRQDFSNFDGLVDYSQDNIAGYIQDEWRPSNRLTVNLGLRYEYQRQPDSEDVNPLYPDVQSIPSDGNNWAPRLGFAWDPKGDGRSVVRGGLGVFYNTTPSLLTANALLNNGIRVLDYNINCPGSVCPAGVPTYPNILTNPGALTASRSGIFVFDRKYQQPETTRYSLGFERELVKDLAFGVDFVYARTRFLERVRDANLTVVGVTADGRTRYATGPRPNANFGAIQVFTSDADGAYKAALVSLRKRFSNNYQFSVAYAYSDSKDSQSNERSVSIGANTPEDSNNLNNDYGPSDFDVRHNLVISGVIGLPFGIRLSPLYRWRSGVPYSVGTSVDVNGDGIFNDRANDLVNCDVLGRCDLGPNHASRNDERQQRFQSLDATLSKEFRRIGGAVDITLYLQGFNLQHSANRVVTGGNQNQVVSGGVVSGVQKYSINPNYGVGNRVGSPRQFQVGLRIAY